MDSWTTCFACGHEFDITEEAILEDEYDGHMYCLCPSCGEEISVDW